MQTSTLGNVSLANTNRPRKLFNLSHDVNTTADFGSVQPLGCHLMVPNSKKTVRSKSVLRLAPLVAPPFARIAQKRIDYFVPMSVLTQNFTHLMAQEPVHRGTTTFVPAQVPQMSLDYLSALCLCGAKCTVYRGVGSSADIDSCAPRLYDIGNPTIANIHPAVTDLPSAVTNVWTDLLGDGVLGISPISSYGDFGLSTTDDLGRLNLKNVLPNITNNLWIPLSNCSVASYFDCSSCPDYITRAGSLYDLDNVSLGNPDVVLVYPGPAGSNECTYLAFRLGAMGKRLRKILLGCGYQLNFNSQVKVSLLPLFAFYKAYFDTYGLWLYHSWETSFAYKLLWYADQASTNYSFDSLFDASSATSNDFWQFFIKELSCCYYTDEQDFTSAHIRNSGVSPSPISFVSSINTDVSNVQNNVVHLTTSEVSPNEPSDLTTVNGHLFINNSIHGQMDSELLKKLYKMVNRNTIAGRRVAELLRSQGLGSYVDNEKSYFIGQSEEFVNIDDVISQSDTFDSATNQGSLLGEYGGRGILGNSIDSMTYETNEFGYWVTLFVVYPKSGFSEQLDGTVLARTKWQFYNPEFDGLGMQFSRKLLVHGSQTFQDADAASGSQDDSFGLIPRYSEWKIAQNKMNGDFNRNETRARYLPYNLDKIIDVGSRTVVKTATPSGYTLYRMDKSFKSKDMPIAGDVWRFTTRYPWLGRFTRIFKYTGERDMAAAQSYATQLGASWYEICDTFGLDNFLFQSIENEQYYAPMLPLEDSFETKEEGNDGPANGSSSKA